MDRHCDHYGVAGHVNDTCFKLHGYSDWYKDLKGKKSETFSMVHANFVGTPLNKDQDSLTNKTSKKDHLINFSYLADFAGNTVRLAFHSLDFLPNDTWIIDTGDSNHM